MAAMLSLTVGLHRALRSIVKGVERGAMSLVHSAYDEAERVHDRTVQIADDLVARAEKLKTDAVLGYENDRKKVTALLAKLSSL